MKPFSITRAGLGLTLIIVAASVTVAAYGLWQAETRARDFSSHEQAVARGEIREALAAQEWQLRRVGRELAQWPETRAQLSAGGRYREWRDGGVWAAGILPCATDSLALYGRDGQILAPERSAEALPAVLPAGELPYFQTARRAGHEHLDFYHPVYSDGPAPVLLGYLGLRVDLLPELRSSGDFALVDPASLAVDVPDGTAVDLRQLATKIRYELRPSHYRTEFINLFRENHLYLVLLLLAALAGVALLLHRGVAQPLRAMARDIETLKNAHDLLDELQSRPSPIQEVDALRRALLDYRDHLARRHRHLELSARQFEHEAHHDALTGAFNRRAFDRDMDSGGGMRSSDRHALLLIDCDHFKAINDTYGHGTGDEVLRAVACRLQDALRSGDRLYRLGGDEFVILLPGADLATARAVAERCLQQARQINHQRLALAEPVRLSIGIAVDDGEGLSVRELHQRADMAMYQAKQSNEEKVVSHCQIVAAHS